LEAAIWRQNSTGLRLCPGPAAWGAYMCRPCNTPTAEGHLAATLPGGACPCLESNQQLNMRSIARELDLAARSLIWSLECSTCRSGRPEARPDRLVAGVLDLAFRSPGSSARSSSYSMWPRGSWDYWGKSGSDGRDICGEDFREEGVRKLVQ
jgi:hypothetical protein